MLHTVTRGEGHPILILHGSTLDHRHMMESLEPVLAGVDGWRRVYVDLPGHGQSPPREDIRTQDDLLAAVMSFARSYFGKNAFAIVGESRGSYIAQGMAHMMPETVSGVALIVPGGSPTADPARLPKHQILRPDPSLRDELSENEIYRFENMLVIQTREILEKARRTKSPARALWDEAQEERVGQAFDFSFHKRGETTEFDKPSLILAGRQDSMSGYLDAIDLMPQFTRASLAVLDTAGHSLAWERPDVFKALILDWLERLGAETPTG